MLELYIGTYTGVNGGIYHARFNLETGELSNPELAAKADNPSFLALSPDGKSLYAVGEVKGELSAYAVAEDGGLTYLNTVPTEGAYPCHLAVDAAGRNVYVANYGTGNAIACHILRDGSLVPFRANFQNAGTGPNPNRQEGPHMHSVYLDAKGRNLYACDLGTDEVLLFCLEGLKDESTLGEPRRFKVPAGAGPRHLSFHPSGKFLYVNGEMGNMVIVHSVDESGGLTQIQTLSTVPADWTQGGGTAEIAIHPNGKWLLVSNRGHDSVAIYALGEDGKLTLKEIPSAGVAEPRHFALTPDGKWLLVEGQNSKDIAVFAFDPETGHPTLKGKTEMPDKPVCIVFRS
ncbi:lactonase family protein [soil metagenome]